MAGCENTIIPTDVTTIGTIAFEYCRGLTSISIPNSVTSIESSAFRGCSGLTSFIIPSSVTSISNGMLRECTGLTSIEIPSTVTSIGDWAFAECNLSSVTVKHSTPTSIAGEPFDRTNITLYVPAGCKAAYEADDYWKDFKEIKEIEEVETMATVTIGAAGMATYSNSRALDFTDVEGLKAFIASGFNSVTGEQTLTRARSVPAGEGLVVKGAKGTYQVPYKASTNFYANLLVGVPEATTVNPTEGNKTNLILKNDAVKGLGFHPLSKAGTIGPNKAYLQIPTSLMPSGSRMIKLVFVDDEEEVTGISDAARLNEKEEMRNEKFFDLQGHRVTKPTRGLYVKDGKKVFVK